MPDKELMKDYVSALLTHIRSYGALCSGYTVDTVYIGGGTPTCLGPKYLGPHPAGGAEQVSPCG